MKKVFSLLLVILLSNWAIAQITDYSIFDKKFNFLCGQRSRPQRLLRPEAYSRADGNHGRRNRPRICSCHRRYTSFEGVRSVNDPLWMTNYELIYSHPELMIDWFPVLGNHEYRGNTQAVLDYTNISRRWTMPARYYTKAFEDKGTTIRIVWIDTAPMMDKYRNDSATYPDACKQDLQKQLSWIDSVLTSAKEDWIIVAGHHPIYAETSKDDSERLDMQKRLDPILRKHKVDMYICGHIHNFQHIRRPGSDIDYIVNSAGSLARKVKPTEGTVFCNPEPGFSVVSADKKELTLRMIDKKGNILHTISRKK